MWREPPGLPPPESSGGVFRPLGTSAKAEASLFASFAELRERFPARHEHVRTLVRVSIDRIADSCGYGVPRYRYEGEREQLVQWASKQGADGVRRYAEEHNRESLDGLPGLRGV